MILLICMFPFIALGRIPLYLGILTGRLSNSDIIP